MGSPAATPPLPPGPIILFDGVCNLCNGAVQFIIDRDPKGVFHFASLQSEAAHALLTARGKTLPEGDPETLLLLERDAVYDRSTAALRIARRLRGGWPVFAVLLALPRFVRDPAYGFVARHRYGWFGKTESCRLPTPELRARFVD